MNTDLDRWITGNYGEDQYADEPDAYSFADSVEPASDYDNEDLGDYLKETLEWWEYGIFLSAYFVPEPSPIFDALLRDYRLARTPIVL